MKLTEKDLNVLIEKFLFEKEEKNSLPEEINFTLFLNLKSKGRPRPPIQFDFSAKLNEKTYGSPKVTCKDDKIDSFLRKNENKPIYKLIIVIEKMKELIETGNEKKLLSDLVHFVKKFETSIDQSITDPQEIISFIETKKKWFDIAIDKLASYFKSENNNLLK